MLLQFGGLLSFESFDAAGVQRVFNQFGGSIACDGLSRIMVVRCCAGLALLFDIRDRHIYSFHCCCEGWRERCRGVGLVIKLRHDVGGIAAAGW